MSSDEIAEMVAFVDCMATRGYIQESLQPGKFDIAAHDVASIACMAQPSGEDQSQTG